MTINLLKGTAITLCMYGNPDLVCEEKINPNILNVGLNKGFIFQVGERKFRAHRIILAASIPYFNAMFTHDMVESKQDEISMQGIDPK